MNRSQNPIGHKEGRASFPNKSQYKNLNNQYLKSLERRGRKRREEKKMEVAREGAACCPGRREKEPEREGEEVRGYLTPTTLNLKD